MSDPPDLRGDVLADPLLPDEGPTRASRRLRFRQAISELAERSTSNDLVRWMLVPGSVAVLLGFVVMLLGWFGAARTSREIEQIPYLISGGIVGLALVVLGGLLLLSTFWVAVLRKLNEEAEGRAARQVEDLRHRLDDLEAARATSNGTRRPRVAGATTASKTRAATPTRAEKAQRGT